jgi:outer membrane protein assembly factor BamB
MPTAVPERSPARPPIRLWPGVVAVALQWFVWLVLPLLVVESIVGYISAFGVLIGGLVIVVWWVFLSRAPWAERLGGLALMVAGVAGTRFLLHESVATGGQGFLYYVYVIPGLCLAFVIWTWAGRRLTGRARWATMAATILVACGGWALVRTEGTSAAGSHFRWRWSQTPEERLLAHAAATPVGKLPAAVGPLATGAEWPGFRGPGRDGVVPGLRIATDWSTAPPVELWRRPIGPGWSSFAVAGDLLYTQEQRGEEEIVACYRASSGEPVWMHRDATRFWESNAGAGPRATPTLAGDRVYALGATGILNVLDAASGAPVWSRDVGGDTAKEVSTWGFSGSPLVVGDSVLVAAAGRLAAYDLVTGEPRWLGPDGGAGYSSPHLVTLDGVEQVVLTSAAGATGFAPADGEVLWQHEWDGFSIVQPARTRDGDLLLGADLVGTIRLAVSRRDGGWAAEERWASRRLKPNFNDFVVHEGHAYGFDGAILAAIDLASGGRRWKGGRYGQGQLVLLSAQDLLLVISETGELALVAATPDRFQELARFPALTGKTWNHPVLVGDLLLVRNGQEMAAFRLPRAGG